MTLAETYTLANDAAFRQRIRCAAVAFAQTVMGQNPSTFNRVDEKRQALAALVLADGGAATLDRLSYGVACRINPANVTTPTDAEISTGVQQSWNDLALITGGELAR